MSTHTYLQRAVHYYRTKGKANGLPMPAYLKPLLPKTSKSVQAWRTLKASLIIERGYRCERCGSQRDIELWRKRDAPSASILPQHLELLCPLCSP